MKYILFFTAILAISCLENNVENFVSKNPYIKPFWPQYIKPFCLTYKSECQKIVNIVSSEESTEVKLQGVGSIIIPIVKTVGKEVIKSAAAEAGKRAVNWAINKVKSWVNKKKK